MEYIVWKRVEKRHIRTSLAVVRHAEATGHTSSTHETTEFDDNSLMHGMWNYKDRENHLPSVHWSFKMTIQRDIDAKKVHCPLSHSKISPKRCVLHPIQQPAAYAVIIACTRLSFAKKTALRVVSSLEIR